MPTNEAAHEKRKGNTIESRSHRWPALRSGFRLGVYGLKAAYRDFQGTNQLRRFSCAASLVPSADVIDAAHRNGVPIYGTLFITGLAASRIKNVLVETLKEDSEGSKTFPIARKLVELAKYYMALMVTLSTKKRPEIL